ncbi:hypothetical protein J8273_4774 [Carpediemonas membranifera]|uniref:Uncharacterized protein n=1 Tax=Carpediemonas membranifera TaxID=201153 RepID=A0A8J6E9Q1_9EUKA|nr:hypothetical protein J8273_4774 [Carpediemonas membranifera]|eukprot:KAG9393655.1 hypothetical protein J8273_4774 [Carpediemonas membranifera]
MLLTSQELPHQADIPMNDEAFLNELSTSLDSHRNDQKHEQLINANMIPHAKLSNWNLSVTIPDSSKFLQTLLVACAPHLKHFTDLTITVGASFDVTSDPASEDDPQRYYTATLRDEDAWAVAAITEGNKACLDSSISCSRPAPRQFSPPPMSSDVTYLPSLARLLADAIASGVPDESYFTLLLGDDFEVTLGPNGLAASSYNTKVEELIAAFSTLHWAITRRPLSSLPVRAPLFTVRQADLSAVLAAFIEYYASLPVNAAQLSLSLQVLGSRVTCYANVFTAQPTIEQAMIAGYTALLATVRAIRRPEETKVIVPEAADNQEIRALLQAVATRETNFSLHFDGFHVCRRAGSSALHCLPNDVTLPGAAPVITALEAWNVDHREDTRTVAQLVTDLDRPMVQSEFPLIVSCGAVTCEVDRDPGNNVLSASANAPCEVRAVVRQANFHSNAHAPRSVPDAEHCLKKAMKDLTSFEFFSAQVDHVMVATRWGSFVLDAGHTDLETAAGELNQSLADTIVKNITEKGPDVDARLTTDEPGLAHRPAPIPRDPGLGPGTVVIRFSGRWPYGIEKRKGSLIVRGAAIPKSVRCLVDRFNKLRGELARPPDVHGNIAIDTTTLEPTELRILLLALASRYKPQTQPQVTLTGAHGVSITLDSPEGQVPYFEAIPADKALDDVLGEANRIIYCAEKKTCISAQTVPGNRNGPGISLLPTPHTPVDPQDVVDLAAAAFGTTDHSLDHLVPFHTRIGGLEVRLEGQDGGPEWLKLKGQDAASAKHGKVLREELIEPFDKALVVLRLAKAGDPTTTSVRITGHAGLGAGLSMGRLADLISHRSDWTNATEFAVQCTDKNDTEKVTVRGSNGFFDLDLDSTVKSTFMERLRRLFGFAEFNELVSALRCANGNALRTHLDAIKKGGKSSRIVIPARFVSKERLGEAELDMLLSHFDFEADDAEFDVTLTSIFNPVRVRNKPFETFDPPQTPTGVSYLWFDPEHYERQELDSIQRDFIATPSAGEWAKCKQAVLQFNQDRNNDVFDPNGKAHSAISKLFKDDSPDTVALYSPALDWSIASEAFGIAPATDRVLVVQIADPLPCTIALSTAGLKWHGRPGTVMPMKELEESLKQQVKAGTVVTSLRGKEDKALRNRMGRVVTQFIKASCYIGFPSRLEGNISIRRDFSSDDGRKILRCIIDMSPSYRPATFSMKIKDNDMKVSATVELKTERKTLTLTSWVDESTKSPDYVPIKKTVEVTTHSFATKSRCKKIRARLKDFNKKLVEHPDPEHSFTAGMTDIAVVANPASKVAVTLQQAESVLTNPATAQSSKSLVIRMTKPAVTIFRDTKTGFYYQTARNASVRKLLYEENREIIRIQKKLGKGVLKEDMSGAKIVIVPPDCCPMTHEEGCALINALISNITLEREAWPSKFRIRFPVTDGSPRLVMSVGGMGESFSRSLQERWADLRSSESNSSSGMSMSVKEGHEFYHAFNYGMQIGYSRRIFHTTVAAVNGWSRTSPSSRINTIYAGTLSQPPTNQESG